MKLGIASTLHGDLIVGAQSFHVNPYGCHTLREQLEQVTILMQDSHAKPATNLVDLGYRWVDTDNPNVHIEHRGKTKRIIEQDRKLLRRRQAIKFIIGHLNSDHRMDRCRFKGDQGDGLHAALCAAGYNIRWLLRMIEKKGTTFLLTAFFSLKQACAQVRSLLDSVMKRYLWAGDVRSALASLLTCGAGSLSQT